MMKYFFPALLVSIANFAICDDDILWNSARKNPECTASISWNSGNNEINEWHFRPDPGKARRYKQELAVWASPALAIIDGRPMAFIGGADQTLHALDLLDKKQVWSKISNAEITDAPAVGELDGRPIVFWASSDRTLYANDAISGEKVWTHELVPPSSTLGNVRISSPLFHAGTLFITCFAYDKSLLRNSQNSWLFAIDAGDGRILWKIEVGQGQVNSPGGIEIDGKYHVFVVAKKGLLQAFDASGEKIFQTWTFQMPHEVLGSPCLMKPENSPAMLFLGSKYGNIIALDAKTGKEIWQRMAGNWIDNTVCAGRIGKTDMVLAGSHDYNVHAFKADDGELIWKTPLGGEIYSAPVLSNLDGKQIISVAALNNHLYILNALDGKIITSYFTGNPVWDKIAKGETLWGSPAVLEAGKESAIVHGSYSGTVYVLPLQKECSLQSAARSAKGLWISLAAVAIIFSLIILPLTIKIK